MFKLFCLYVIIFLSVEVAKNVARTTQNYKIEETTGNLTQEFGFTTQIPIRNKNGTDVLPAEWHRDEFPNPRLDVNKCGRLGKLSFVCDPDNILTVIQGKTIN